MTSRLNHSVLLALLFALATASSCSMKAKEPLARGKDLFEGCKACHGPLAGGNPAVKAPAIAGLPAWYVEAQLIKFRTGVRGAHPDDMEGLRMRPLSQQLYDANEVTLVSNYVASLPVAKGAATLKGGDATAGQASYATCLACHGPDGKGNLALRAPPIAQLEDWYLLAQLKKFKAGIRGTNAKDTTGAQMRPMAMTLADEQAMKNVVAHISTLGAK